MTAKVIHLPARPVHSIDELLKNETPETREYVLVGIIKELFKELLEMRRQEGKQRSAAIVKLPPRVDEPS
jgi:hypothetical protein